MLNRSGDGMNEDYNRLMNRSVIRLPDVSNISCGQSRVQITVAALSQKG